MGKKKITFHSERPDLDLLKPMPTSRVMPEWFRLMPGSVNGIETIKKCVPVLDALTSGYIIPIPADAYWDKESGRFTSAFVDKLDSDHMKDQTSFIEIPDNFDDQPHKWINRWFIKTPKGYSTLFIHPLNRQDLPFRSFSGIVDTDKHPMPVNFPFILEKDFDGMIPAGTPMIQAIPFKRDDWKSEIIDSGQPYEYPYSSDNMNPPFAWYKRKWWSRKLYS